jgi:hypothetical protein
MHYRKILIRTISMGMAAAMLAGAGLLSGCTAATDVPAPPAVVEDKQDKTMLEFRELAAANSKPDVLLQYVDKHISSGISAKDASTMLIELEKAQESYMAEHELKYFNNSEIQEKLAEIYMSGFELNKSYETKDPELKALLEETKAMGYKLETAEGMFFPIMDYGYLKKYSIYAEDDIRAYIDIMAAETDKVPAKDAALMISWDEIISRGLAQEDFIEKHKESLKLEAVKKLHDKYITFILYGLNNTPLFHYENKTMDSEARAAYEKALTEPGNSGSELMKLLGDYMELVKESEYKLSKAVENFRNSAVESN